MAGTGFPIGLSSSSSSSIYPTATPSLSANTLAPFLALYHRFSYRKKGTASESQKMYPELNKGNFESTASVGTI